MASSSMDNLIDDAKSTNNNNNNNSFPKRAVIQTFDHNNNPPPDYQLVIEELKKRTIPYTLYTTEEIEWSNSVKLTKNDLVVGNFDWTRWAVKQLGLTMPQPPDYPNCLKYLLHRKVWKTTLIGAKIYLSEHKFSEIFIKPFNDAKSFAAIIEPKDQMIDTLLNGIPGIMYGHNANEIVWCSEVIKMGAEYRVYVVNGEIRAICQYRGLKLNKNNINYNSVSLNMNIVKKAVNTLFKSNEGKTLTGCAMDFAIMEKNNNYITCLVEVNDGFSLGRYDGINGKDYTDLLIARWKQLVNT